MIGTRLLLAVQIPRARHNLAPIRDGFIKQRRTALVALDRVALAQQKPGTENSVRGWCEQGDVRALARLPLDHDQPGLFELLQAAIFHPPGDAPTGQRLV